MTGANPGTHGIFGFTDLRPNTYELRFPSSRDVKAPTLWERLGDHGKRSVIVNQPSTYPARQIEGVLVSGFVAVDLAKAVSPPAVKETLLELGYEIDVDTLRAREDPDFLFSELARTLEARERVVEHLWDTEDWDFFETVITGTDRLMHFAWDALEDPVHPLRDAAMGYFARVDSAVGRIYDRFESASGRKEEGDGFYLLSDHGFCGIEQEVFLNAWLRDEGYLVFETAEPRSLEDVSAKAKAFALDPGRIHVHREGHYPKGSVPAAEADALKDEIAEKLRALTWEGRPVVREVFDRDAIYSGPYTQEGPDLVVLSHRGFDLKGSVKRREVFGRTEGLVGMHTWDDAFFWSLSAMGEDLAIHDLMDPILAKCLEGTEKKTAKRR
jgi:predicted AlkP superfamily phosphohydrolase/phosphomutase